MSQQKLKAKFNFLLVHYRTLVHQLEGRVFYKEDEDGILRRWTPPSMAIMETMLKDLEERQNDE